MSKITLTKSQFAALEAITKLNDSEATVEQKAAAATEVKNLIKGHDITKGISTEVKTVAQKFFEDVAMGRKGLTEGGNAGSLVPVEASAEIIDSLPQFGFAFNKCSTRRMRSNSMKVSSVGQGVTVQWLNEAGQGAETTIPWTALTLTTAKSAAIGIISNEEIADAVVDVAELVKNVLAASIAKEIDRVIFQGQSGVFTSGLRAVSGVNAVTVATAANDQVMADALIDLQTAVPAYAMAGGVYVTSPSGWGKMRKLKDTTGQYLARGASGAIRGNNPQSGSTASPAGYFDEKEVYVVEGINAFGTAANVPVIYGDFKFMVIGIKDEMNALTTQEGSVGSISMYDTDQTAVRLTSRIAFAAVPAAFSKLVLS
jgi:HK97 family phage major capsid protein